MAGRVVELIFRGDNRSAVRALSGIASESDKATRKLKKDSKESGSAFGAMGTATGKLRGAVGGLAGAVGLGGLAFGIKNVVQAGEEWQTQQAQLRGALRNTGQYSKTALDSLDAAASKLAGRGGFSASENVHALTQLVTATGSTGKAMRDTALATDIARRTGRDYTTIVKAIALAEQGRTTGLARLGIALPKTSAAEDALAKTRNNSKTGLQELLASGVKLTAAQKAQFALSHQVTPEMVAQAKAQDKLAATQNVIAQLQAKFGGAAGAFSKTTAGRVSNLRNSFKELKEQLGTGLLPVMNRVVSTTATLLGWLNKHRTILYVLLGATAAFSAAVVFNSVVETVLTTKTLLLAAATRASAAASGEATVATKGLSLATLIFGNVFRATIIGAVITAIVLVVTHFKTVKRVAKDVFGWIKTAVKDVGHWISHAFTTAFHAIGTAAKWLMTHTPLGGLLSAASNLAHGHFGKAAGAFAKGATFGLLNTGGVVKPRYFAGGGPVGMDTVPGFLTPGEGIVNTRGMGVLGQGGLAALNAGHAPASGHGEITWSQPLILKVDGRVLAEAVTRAVLRKAARGPSSLSGGSLMAGPGHAA